MLSASLGLLLKIARKQLGLSRAELARQAKVSPRLLAELERGERPNVSLETALRLLSLAGVSITAIAPVVGSVEVPSTANPMREREARAAHRRATWTGRIIDLHDDHDDPPPPRSRGARLAAVAEVSKNVHIVATAAGARAKPHAAHKPRKPRGAAR